MAREKYDRYSVVSIILHWTIAVLLISNVYVGGWLEEAPRGEGLARLEWHKSIGLTVLFLSLFRLGWRIAHPWPALPDGMKSWERVLSHITHYGFYVVMIGVPLLGWLAVSFRGAPEVPLWGFIPAPNLPVGEARELGGMFADWHHTSVKAIYILLALHVAGALKHYFVDRDIVVTRMIPGLPKWRGGKGS